MDKIPMLPQLPRIFTLDEIAAIRRSVANSLSTIDRSKLPSSLAFQLVESSKPLKNMEDNHFQHEGPRKFGHSANSFPSFGNQNKFYSNVHVYDDDDTFGVSLDDITNSSPFDFSSEFTIGSTYINLEAKKAEYFKDRTLLVTGVKGNATSASFNEDGEAIKEDDDFVSAAKKKNNTDKSSSAAASIPHLNISNIPKSNTSSSADVWNADGLGFSSLISAPESNVNSLFQGKSAPTLSTSGFNSPPVSVVPSTISINFAKEDGSIDQNLLNSKLYEYNSQYKLMSDELARLKEFEPHSTPGADPALLAKQRHISTKILTILRYTSGVLKEKNSSILTDKELRDMNPPMPTSETERYQLGFNSQRDDSGASIQQQKPLMGNEIPSSVMGMFSSGSTPNNIPLGLLPQMMNAAQQMQGGNRASFMNGPNGMPMNGPNSGHLPGSVPNSVIGGVSQIPTHVRRQMARQSSEQGQASQGAMGPDSQNRGAQNMMMPFLPNTGSPFPPHSNMQHSANNMGMQVNPGLKNGPMAMNPANMGGMGGMLPQSSGPLLSQPGMNINLAQKIPSILGANPAPNAGQTPSGHGVGVSGNASTQHIFNLLDRSHFLSQQQNHGKSIAPEHMNMNMNMNMGNPGPNQGGSGTLPAGNNRFPMFPIDNFSGGAQNNNPNSGISMNMPPQNMANLPNLNTVNSNQKQTGLNAPNSGPRGMNSRPMMGSNPNASSNNNMGSNNAQGGGNAMNALFPNMQSSMAANQTPMGMNMNMNMPMNMNGMHMNMNSNANMGMQMNMPMNMNMGNLNMGNMNNNNNAAAHAQNRGNPIVSNAAPINPNVVSLKPASVRRKH